ncbi:MAG: DUF4142 domain-containing protein [Proteobacteria bacterium]|nr:DUF4142 domain-containing protein [Pseudomonadota bacterium]
MHTGGFMEFRKLFIMAVFISVTVASALAYANTMSKETFVQKASLANLFEIESSQLAINKSQNPEVKKFAQRMVTEHKKTGQELKDLLTASQLSIRPETKLDDTHRRLMAKLEDATREDFDNEYISIQTQAHKEAVALFAEYSEHGENGKLKEFAQSTRPTLKDHLKHVESLEANY